MSKIPSTFAKTCRERLEFFVLKFVFSEQQVFLKHSFSHPRYSNCVLHNFTCAVFVSRIKQAKNRIKCWIHVPAWRVFPSRVLSSYQGVDPNKCMIRNCNYSLKRLCSLNLFLIIFRILSPYLLNDIQFECSTRKNCF